MSCRGRGGGIEKGKSIRKINKRIEKWHLMELIELKKEIRGIDLKEVLKD